MKSKKLFKDLKAAVKFLQKRYKQVPEVGIVLGSGLGDFTNDIVIEKEVSYKDIPNFPVSTVKGHSGKLIFGKLGGKTVVVMAGRFHYYEGYDSNDVVFPIRVMKLLGVETLFLSNAAGGVNPEYRVGDIMIIRDHISLYVPNPLVGPNIEEFGPRFPDMSEPYKRTLIQRAKEIASANQFELKTGVYFGVTGPTFETRAEYEMIHRLGGDVVGMSTVQEVIIAHHMGLQVFAMSVVTDMGLREDGIITTHDEVLEAAKAASPKLATIFRELVACI
ncbi:MAG: purine-nucleoside phosphorylase [Chitinophagaceae bacterium]|nr:purine-nucleoside phosphorylase [Chitinophagaceae bacterium]